MSNAQIIKIKELATELRSAIKTCEDRFKPFWFKDFPSGTCLDSCLLLIRWFAENKLNSFTIVKGSRNGSSHAWLEKEGIIIDITANQFEDNYSEVMVTRDKSWHLQFEEERRTIETIEDYDDPNSSRLIKFYNYLLRNKLKM